MGDTLRSMINQGLYADTVNLFIGHKSVYHGDMQHIPWFLLGMETGCIIISDAMEINLY